MHKYLKNHVGILYDSEYVSYPGIKIYTNKHGWSDYYIGKNLLYSHRTTTYSMAHFPDKLHSHDHYEMDIFINGQISYIISDHEIFPQKYGILLIPPGIVHTARQAEKEEYDRIVFYFDQTIFSFLEHTCLPSFLRNKEATYFSIDPEYKADFHYLLDKLQYTLTCPTDNASLHAFSLVIQLFLLMDAHRNQEDSRFSKLPKKILQIKTYIDDNFQEIADISEIAEHFYYSREYISRIFKQYFNMNISDYIKKKKIDAARHALENGMSVTQAFSLSGYHSMSAFISAFQSATSMLPSNYKKKWNSKN